MSCFFSLLVLNLGLIVSETSFRSGPHLHKVKSALNHNKKKRHFHQNRLLSEKPRRKPVISFVLKKNISWTDSSKINHPAFGSVVQRGSVLDSHTSISTSVWTVIPFWVINFIDTSNPSVMTNTSGFQFYYMLYRVYIICFMKMILIYCSLMILVYVWSFSYRVFQPRLDYYRQFKPHGCHTFTVHPPPRSPVRALLS